MAFLAAAAGGAFFELLIHLLRKGGRQVFKRALGKTPGGFGSAVAKGARMRLVKKAAVSGGAFGGFDLAMQALMGEGTPQEEVAASNKDLLGFYGQGVSPSETPSIEDLLSMMGEQGFDDSSGRFI